MDERKRRRGGLVGPMILIGLGVVFLLNNLGMVSWDMWDVILSLWPILLIAAGLDVLIGRRSALGSLLVLVLTLAILAGGLWLFETSVGTARGMITQEIGQPLDGASRAEVSIEPGFAALHIEALPESSNLVTGVIHVGKQDEVTRDFAIEGGTATFSLDSSSQVVGPFIGTRNRAWNLRLNPDVPLKLKIGLGVGKSEIDLTGLTVSDLRVETDIGRTTVTLPARGRFEAKVEGAIGTTVVIIPEGLAARIRVETGLSVSHVPDDYERQGDVYTSPDYERADDRVDLQVSQDIGTITVRH